MPRAKRKKSESDNDVPTLESSTQKSETGVQEKRRAPYRPTCPTKLHDRLLRANTQRMYLIEQKLPGEETDENGSTTPPLSCVFSVLGSTGNVYTVHLKHVSTCTCPDFSRNHDLCKHIIFVLLKVIGLSSENPLSFQRAYVTSELQEIMEMLRNRRVGGDVMANEEVRTNFASLQTEGEPIAPTINGVKRRSIENEDYSDCPVCFDQMDLNDTKNPLTYCQGTCGSNFHVECIVKWLMNCPTSSCPNCRQPWIGKENKKDAKSGKKKQINRSYVNLATLQGLSTVRDTSTYNSPQGESSDNKRRRC